MHKRYIRTVIIIGALIIVGLLVYSQISNPKNNDSQKTTSDRGIAGTPIDVTLDFYQDWLSARNSTTTDPYAADLAQAQVLNRNVSKQISDAENTFKENGVDIVLCGTSVPSKIRAKSIFEKDAASQILIRPKDGTNTAQQIVVTLASHDNLWEITAIDCNVSEQAPDTGAFNFDTEGYLLKDSLTASFNKKYWHLVFEQDGVPGHTAPLHFSDTAVCILNTGAEEICTNEMFFETAHVYIQGNMTEAGANVERVEFIE